MSADFQSCFFPYIDKCSGSVGRVVGLKGASLSVLSLVRGTFYPLLSTGPTQEDRKISRQDCKNVDWDIKHQHKLSKILNLISNFKY